MAKKRVPKTETEAQPTGQVLQFSDFVGVPRSGAHYVGRNKVDLAEIDEATRDLHAAARTVQRLVFAARMRMGLPPLG